MSEFDAFPCPFELTTVAASALGGDRFILRLEGRWLTRVRPSLRDAELCVDEGRRQHRFPAAPQPRRGRLGRSTWALSCTLPVWLAVRLEGNTVLKVAEATLPLPEGAFTELVIAPEDVDAESHGVAEAESNGAVHAESNGAGEAPPEA